MESQAPDYYANITQINSLHNRIDELEDRIYNIEEMFMKHIHQTNELLGITGGPKEPINLTKEFKE